MRKIPLLFLSILLCILTNAQNKEITVEDIYKNYNFYTKSYQGLKSMNDGEFYTQMKRTEDGQEIIKYNFKNGDRITRLFKSSDFKIGRINSYTLSHDDKLMILATETESIYRYSKRAIYYVFNIHNNKLKKISEEKIRYPTFCPNNEKIAFVFNNNLYIKNILNGKETQITFDGKKNHIINGASDWVYEEEFRLVKGFEWSSNGEIIAYYKFDESHVKEFSMDKFNGNLYPTQEVFKYPKAGEANSTVNVYLYNLNKKKKV